MNLSDTRDLRHVLRGCALLFCALDVFLIVWLLSPWAPSRARAEQRLRDRQQEFTRLQNEVSGLHRFDHDLLLSHKQMAELFSQGMPPADKAYSTILLELQRISSDTGAQASAVNFHPKHKAVNGLLQVQVNASLSGNYSQVVHFINELERSPLFLIINSVSLSPTQRQGAAGALRLNIGLESFVQAPPGAATSKPTATATTANAGAAEAL